MLPSRRTLARSGASGDATGGRLTAPLCPLRYAAARPNRFSARARALAASTSRSRGGADVTRSSRRCAVMCAISSTACMNTASFAFDGLVDPLTLRTYWSAAARISSEVAAGSQLWSVLMFRHMPPSLAAAPVAAAARRLRPHDVAGRQPACVLAGDLLAVDERATTRPGPAAPRARGGVTAPVAEDRQ